MATNFRTSQEDDRWSAPLEKATLLSKAQRATKGTVTPKRRSHKKGSTPTENLYLIADSVEDLLSESKAKSLVDKKLAQEDRKRYEAARREIKANKNKSNTALKDFIKKYESDQDTKDELIAEIAYIKKELEDPKSKHSKLQLLKFKDLEQSLEKALSVMFSADRHANKELYKKSMKEALGAVDEVREALSTKSKISLDEEKERRAELIERIKDRAESRREFKAGVRDWFKDKAMGAADRLGIGSLNLGNAIRLGKKVKSGVSAVKGWHEDRKEYKNIQRYAADPKDVTKENQKQRDGQKENRKYLANLTKAMMANVKSNEKVSRFTQLASRAQQAVARALGKSSRVAGGAAVGAAGAAGAGAAKGGVGLEAAAGGAAGGILAMLGKYIKTGVAAVIGPIAVGLRAAGPAILKFITGGALGTIAGVVGSAFAGWKLGTYLYDTFGTEIQDGIEFVMNAVKNIWKTITETFDVVVGRVKKFFTDKWDALKGFGKGALKKMDSTVDTVNSSLGMSIPKPSAVIASVPAVVNSSVAAAKDAGINVLASAGSAVKSIAESDTVTGIANTVGPVIDKAKTSVSDLIGKYTKKATATVDVDGLQPSVAKNLGGMAQEFNAQTGQNITVNSAYRSNEKQKQLYDAEMAKPPGSRIPVAKPGTSVHNFGLGVDIPSAQADKLDSMGLLAKYGFSRPVPGEKWHLQPTGVTSAAAAKGIYSADYVDNQGGSSEQSQTKVATEKAPSVVPSEGGSRENSTAGQAQGTQGQQVSSPQASAAPPGSKASASSVPLFSTVNGSLMAWNVGAYA